MERNQFGLIVGIIIATVWIWLGFSSLILILLAGLAGYIIASLTGSQADTERFRKQVNRLLGQRSRRN